jgi:hypothetical protein
MIPINPLACSDPRCCVCGGLGTLRRGSRELAVCNCVARTAFDVVLRRWKRCAFELAEVIAFGHRPGRPGANTTGQRRAEYLADVVLTARKSLDPESLALFEAYAYGVPHERTAARLGITLAALHGRIKKLKTRLGHMWLELEPYSLIPSVYFSRLPTGTPAPPPRSVPEPVRKPVPLRPPLAQRALKRAA